MKHCHRRNRTKKILLAHMRHIGVDETPTQVRFWERDTIIQVQSRVRSHCRKSIIK